MDKPSLFETTLTNGGDACLVHLADGLGQYVRAPWNRPSRCERALALARDTDVVVLSRMPDPVYLNWLREMDLGTSHLVSYQGLHPGGALSRTIADYPEPVAERIIDLDKPKVLVPWYAGEAEEAAARSLDMGCLGAGGKLSWKHNDKAAFKDLCQWLRIPVLPGTTLTIGTASPWAEEAALVRAIDTHCKTTGIALVRAARDISGMGMTFKTRGEKIHRLYAHLADQGGMEILVEPLVAVQVSPTDQWFIPREGRPVHLGLLERVGEIGSSALLSCDFFQPPGLARLKLHSRKIIQALADDGYTGPVGIDYIVDAQDQVYPVDINARFSRAAYMALLVERLSHGVGSVDTWKYLRARTAPGAFSQVAGQLGEWLYDGNTDTAVFPWDCETLGRDGELGLLLMSPDIKGIAHLENILERVGMVWI